MNQSLVMTIIGPDRPGLVESVSRLVADHGGNWLESRMAQLAGNFAGILRLDVPAGRIGEMKAALAALETEGLRIVMETGAGEPEAAAMRPFHLEVVGNDRPGIVRDISHTLAARGVNVEELSTECSSAPMSAEMLFRANAHLQVPAGVDEDDILADLEKIAEDLVVDIKLKPS